ncbi:hypothetical protein [Xanthobacter autotrophicus]|uniref:hypothetical protein n=1 Tax=Xanthobacter autotrophicus TaxID=280 RepID=UPI0024A7980E|nr:hypothetical protein [Xanthobacter autotrophicus]MDI4656840.1 hypothetical protein [Xanthobacter autotrophicus]
MKTLLPRSRALRCKGNAIRFTSSLVEGGRVLLSQMKLRFCENPNRKADREPGILLDQGFDC